MPRTVVLIPMYNHVETLRPAVQCTVAQTDPDVVVHRIGDGAPIETTGNAADRSIELHRAGCRSRRRDTVWIPATCRSSTSCCVSENGRCSPRFESSSGDVNGGLRPRADVHSGLRHVEYIDALMNWTV